MAYLTVQQETDRIARLVELTNALALERPSATAAKLVGQAQLLKTKQLAAQIIPFYSNNDTLRSNFISQIASLQSAYRAAGGTGDPTLPPGSPVKADDSVFTPVVTAAAAVPGWALLAAGLGVGYLVFKKK